MTSIRPIFILSLPRSGSTLLQGLLTADPLISSVPEPWLLLPIFYARRNNGIHAEYGQALASTAINEFIGAMPDEDGDFHDAVNRFACDLYSRAAADGCAWFVDKTPRYHLVVDELFQTFPQGKFIFLFRNPLAIVASMIETWGHGRWNLDRFELDLDHGMRALMKASQRYTDRSISINYESLVEDPDSRLGSIRDYLGMDGSFRAAAQVSVSPPAGSMGDQAGIRRYSGLSNEPLDKWRRILSNPLRKSWCRRYLARFDKESWERIGYRQEEMLADLDSVTPTIEFLWSDTWRRAKRRLAGGS